MFTMPHVVLNTSDINKAKEFYVEKFGFEILDSAEHFLAFKAGDVRFSVFPGGKKLDLDKDPKPNIKCIFGTQNIDEAFENLKARGVKFLDDEIQDAPGFMRFIPFADPDENVFFLGQYVTDPKTPKHQ